MQYPSKSGKMFGSQKQAFDDGSSAPTDQGQQGDPSQPQPITDNPEAMQCIDKLQQLGYTADDVAQAMQSDSGQDQSQAAPPTKGAPMSIPGMG